MLRCYHALSEIIGISKHRHFFGRQVFNLVYIWLIQDELNYHMMSLLMIWPVPIELHCQNFVRVSSLVHLRKKTNKLQNIPKFCQKSVLIDIWDLR